MVRGIGFGVPKVHGGRGGQSPQWRQGRPPQRHRGSSRSGRSGGRSGSCPGRGRLSPALPLRLCCDHRLYLLQLLQSMGWVLELTCISELAEAFRFPVPAVHDALVSQEARAAGASLRLLWYARGPSASARNCHSSRGGSSGKTPVVGQRRAVAWKHRLGHGGRCWGEVVPDRSRRASGAHHWPLQIQGLLALTAQLCRSGRGHCRGPQWGPTTTSPRYYSSGGDGCARCPAACCPARCCGGDTHRRHGSISRPSLDAWLFHASRQLLRRTTRTLLRNHRCFSSPGCSSSSSCQQPTAPQRLRCWQALVRPLLGGETAAAATARQW